MTKKEYLLQQFEEIRVRRTAAESSKFYAVPGAYRTEPFRMADHLWYVGDKKVCVHLIETPEGHILIDSGYPGAAHLLIDNIWRAGFDPADVRWILHSHAHMDHFGASEDFRAMFGTKLAIGAVDAESVRQYPQRAMMDWGLNPFAPIPTFDRELEDGEIFEFGGVKIRCVLSPGHTVGTMSFFFDVTDNGRTYLAGTFGGAGRSALQLEHITHCECPLDLPRQMLKTLEMLEKEPVEVQLGNHPKNSSTFEKRERQLREGGNPFVDGTTWPAFLEETRRKTLEEIQRNEKLERELDSAVDVED